MSVEAQPKLKKFSRVTAFVVAIENYRKNSLPVVDFAHADGEAFADWVRATYSDLAGEPPVVTVVTDSEASLAALKNDLLYM